MTISAGTRLGRYEIRSLIGAGGMGEVYLAHDPKIGRQVAVKVLPQEFSSDKERLARFEQEAQAAGALNHPNILAIHDIDTHDAAPYVVSEYLEGETLRTAIGSSPLSIRKATDYGLQAALGLAAAHEKGIIHRDLKPDNIFVTSDGRVKILDFGLAKLIEQDNGGVRTDLPTKKVNTDSGTIMGTAGYMSPEQLRGQPVDARTDIFSFGAVLYEMLSGQKAFQRDSAADTISAILREDPPELSETNKSVSQGLERVVRRCIEKNRERRFHSASDLAFALESWGGSQTSGDMTTFISTSGPVEETRNWRQSKWVGWIAAGILLLLLAGLGAMYFRRPEASGRTMRFLIVPPPKTNLSDASAISPDGTQIAFIAVGGSDSTSLWVRNLSTVELHQLPGTEGANFPFWSPDSRSIGFFANSKLKRIDANGGVVQMLADVTSDPRGGTWAPDNTILFSPGTIAPIYKVAATGGEVTQVTTIDESLAHSSNRWPSFLPDGRHFLYFARGTKDETEGIFVGSLDSSETKLVLHSLVRGLYAPSGVSAKTGYLFFVLDGNLMAQPFDPAKADLSGTPALLVQGVLNYSRESGPTAYSACSISQDGTIVYRTGSGDITQPTWFDRSGKRGETIGEPAAYSEPSLSPDGKKILVEKAATAGAAPDLYLFDLTRGSAATRLTFDPAPDISSIFSPDGREVVFSSPRAQRMDLYKKLANGSGSDELFFHPDSNLFADDWSHDGRYILVELDGGVKTRSDLWILSAVGDHTLIPYLQSQFNEAHAHFSPDGHWIVYSSDESGRPEIYVRSFPDSGGKWQISTAGGEQASWRGDGKEIFYMAPDRKLMAVTVNIGASFEVGIPAPLLQTHIPVTGITDDRNSYFATPDGQKFLVDELLESQMAEPLTVVLNWQADLRP